jgi:hypothetical protein
MLFATCVGTAYSILAYSAFVKMCGIFHNTPTISVSEVTTANGDFTPIYIWEGRTILGAKSKLQYG